jgi:tetratricopeptide (TPR) repeat protein
MLWREGDLEGSARLYRRAHELAEQVGWSELAFQTLFGLSLALRDAGELTDAVTALDQAIDVCERAGLIAQSIQAIGTRAVVLSLAGRHDAAAESAGEAAKLSERLHYPIGRAAALEAQGAAADDPRAGAAMLGEAELAWDELERPLEAARCRLLAGQKLAGLLGTGSAPADPERARELLEAAAELIEELGVPHLAEKARTLAAAGQS